MMTNREWLSSLNKQQRRRRKKSGKIPEFAIYRVYNHNAKKWQFPDIISSDKAKAYAEFIKRLGFKSYKWRFEIQPWMIYNLVSLSWEEPQHAFKRGGKEPLEGIVCLHKKALEVLVDDWLKAEHKEG